MFLENVMRCTMTVVQSPTWTSPLSSKLDGEHFITSSTSSFPVFSSHQWLYSVSLFLQTQEKNFHWVSIVLIFDLFKAILLSPTRYFQLAPSMTQKNNCMFYDKAIYPILLSCHLFVIGILHPIC